MRWWLRTRGTVAPEVGQAALQVGRIDLDQSRLDQRRRPCLSGLGRHAGGIERPIGGNGPTWAYSTGGRSSAQAARADGCDRRGSSVNEAHAPIVRQRAAASGYFATLAVASMPAAVQGRAARCDGAKPRCAGKCRQGSAIAWNRVGLLAPIIRRPGLNRKPSRPAVGKPRTVRDQQMLQIARRARVWPGASYPLGATFDGRGVNFALFSANAEKVELCLFDARGQRELERVVLPEYTDQVWHGYLPDVRPGPALRLPRPWPLRAARGHRFNHHKLLLDPYAKQLVGQLHWSDAHFGYRVGGRREDLAFDAARQCPRHAQVPGGRHRIHLGRRPAARHALARQRPLRDAPARLHHAAPGRARTCARHRRRVLAAGGDRPSARPWASPRSSSCRSTPSSRTGTWSSAACPTTGATTRSASSRPSSAIWPPATSPSGRPWSAACTMPASR